MESKILVIMKLYSFDIFDTCLVRTCGCPENVFYILGKEVLGTHVDESILRDFVRERGRAEGVAKQELNKEAVSIDEIYRYFNTSLYTDKDKDVIKNKEIEIERKLLVPVKSLKDKVSECRQKGKVAFVSDMYLPDQMLKDILANSGLFYEGDSLYISGSVGCTKQSGKLFEYVKCKENVEYGEWQHIGDHYISDYLKPKKLGIKARRATHEYNSIENKWIADSVYLKDKWVTKTFAGLSRALRLEKGIGGIDFVINVMMAAFVPFVFCLLQKAREDKIDRLFFASRDTYVLYLMAKRISHLFPEIELRYLYISTKVLYPLYIDKGNVCEIRDILNTLGRFKPKQILLMLGFGESEIQDVRQLIDVDKLYYSNDCKEFLDLFQKNEIKNLVLSRTKEKKNILIEYLKQEKFIGTDRVALFDIGWRGTSQSLLKRLNLDGVKYYYWGVYKTRLPISITGDFFSFSFFEDYYRLGAAKFIEFYMCKMKEGSTLGYKNSSGGIISPVLGKPDISEVESSEIDDNINIMYRSLELFLNIPSIYSYSQDIFNILSINTLHRVAKNPPGCFTKVLKKRMFWDHYVEREKMITFLSPYKIFDILRCLYSKSPKYNGLWIEGSIVYTFRGFGNWLLSRDVSGSVKNLGRYVVGIIK